MSRYAPTRSQPKVPRVDREKTCPSLLRVFVNPLHHHPDSAFTINQVPTQKEFQVYVWRDSTLREILLSLRDAAPQLRGNNAAKFSLKLVFWDSKLDRYTSTDLALIHAKDLSSSSSSSSSSDHRRAPPGGGSGSNSLEKTLSEAKYVVGDFVDVAYILPGVLNSVGGPVSTHASTNGPQFAPLSNQSAGRGGGGGGGGGPVGAFGIRGAAIGNQRGGSRPGGDTWAPTRPAPGAGGGGGGRYGSGRPAPADQGWGNRRPRVNAPEDRNAKNGNRPPRRNSRSLSPERQSSRPRPRSPSRSLSRSPPPAARDRSRSFSSAPKETTNRARDESDAAERRATPPHMKAKGSSEVKDVQEDEEMKD
ncbi:hypothetical protein JCM5350_003612 [Sporobolomyces pararoseus]